LEHYCDSAPAQPAALSFDVQFGSRAGPYSPRRGSRSWAEYGCAAGRKIEAGVVRGWGACHAGTSLQIDAVRVPAHSTTCGGQTVLATIAIRRPPMTTMAPKPAASWR